MSGVIAMSGEAAGGFEPPQPQRAAQRKRAESDLIVAMVSSVIASGVACFGS
jgi:hypothetical protein